MENNAAFVDLLPAARANGAPRWLKRLRVFQARREPIPAIRRRETPGELLEVITLGDVHDPRVLLAVATEYMDGVR